MPPYCVAWSGAYWWPCRDVKERRQAGYLALMMCWPAPLPKAGEYITNQSGRGRFIYEINEVEKFTPPRTAKRYTCRLWVRRYLIGEILPIDNPTIHRFYWHPRKKTRTRGVR
jgi:hypothetical protein